MKKNLVEIVFILDKSGSMFGLENDTIGGFNSMIENQKNEGYEAFVSTVLFNDNYEMFFNMNFLHLWSLERYISNISKEQNTRARLHIFIDKIDDKILQRLINTMIGSRMSIAVMGYSSNEELITYNTNINQVIENPHDYCAYYKEEFYARLRKKYNLE